MVAEVYMSHCPFHIDKGFDYTVPSALKEKIAIGMRVIVPFGKGNRRMEAIVYALRDTSLSEEEGLKPLLHILEGGASVNDEALALARFMKDRFFCTHFDALRLSLGPHSSLDEERFLSLSSGFTKEQAAALDDLQKAICAHLAEKKELTWARFIRVFPDGERAVRALVSAGLVISETRFSPSAKEEMRKVVYPAVSEEEAAKILKAQRGASARRYEKVMELVFHSSPMEKGDLCVKANISPAVFRTMCQKGLIKTQDEPAITELYKIITEDTAPQRGDEADGLTPEQQAAFLGLQALLNQDEARCALLKGITGSGKTHVYIRLIEEVLKQGKNAVVLVPEISLTPQMVSRFTARFPGMVGVLHSAMPIRERLQIYNHIRAGEARIIIGTRMAVFAPLTNIGVIIMDEEQEASYKSEMNPHYHARDIAKFRCVHHNCLLLLASATPSLDSFYQAKRGIYSYFELDKRYGGASLPSVRIVDMSAQIRAGNSSLFSGELIEALRTCLAEKKQAVVLLNRRGYAAFAMCRECGYIPKCPHCSVSLTYHAVGNRLMCHYCGYTTDKEDVCPDCKSPYIRFTGAGTQRVQEDLLSLLPEAKVLRLDADTAKERGAHRKILESFGNGEADILIGTQMVAKGLDFPNVTVVGVLSADSSLYFDDYRCAENTFSMLCQVVGRSGRGDAPGQAVLQVLNPENAVIALSANQDFEGFYAYEMDIRERFSYPPFIDLCVITLSGRFEGNVQKAALQMAKLLKSAFHKNSAHIEATLLGPAPAPVVKVNNRYRWRVMVRCKNTKNFRLLMHRFLESFYAQRGNKEYSLIVDTNPYSML